MSLAMYIILSVLHRHMLDGIGVTTVVRDLKMELSHNDMIVTICMLMHYFTLFTIVGG